MFKKLLQLKTLLVALLVMAGAGNAWAETVTDVLSASDFTATGTTYKPFSNVSKKSDAVYAGQSAKDTSGNIQLRSKNSNSGIVSTTSGGKVKSVKITIGSGSNTIDVYGYNTAFESASDLYNTHATKVGSLTHTGTITFTDDYEYVGIRSYNGAVYISSIEIVWEVAGGSSTETCATPTFSPAAGTYTSAQNVTLSTTTDGAAIYYTTDGTDPKTSSNSYSSAIPVSTTTTIKAIAVKEGMENSYVASATYTIVSLAHAGTEEDPYTVADARTAIDANVGMTDVYAKGIVSEIVTAYSSEYNNITFDIVDENGTATLRAYRCSGTEAANVQVGDIVVVSGNLTTYNDIYEFAAGNLLISLDRKEAAVLESIALSGTYPTTFVEGSEFGHEGMTVIATYEDTSTKNVTASATFEGYDMATPGQQTVTVSYTEGEVTKTASYGITVTEDVRTPVNLTGFSATVSTILRGDDLQTTVTNDQSGWDASYTYSSDNTSVATVDVNGTITAVGRGTANISVALNVNKNDTQYKRGETSNATIEITVVNPSHTATFYNDGMVVSSLSVQEENDIEFPSDQTAEGYAFIGWTTSEIDEPQSTQPELTSSAVMGTSDMNFYAVFARLSETEGWRKIKDLRTLAAGTYAIISEAGNAFNGEINDKGHGQSTDDAFSFTDSVATSAPTGTCLIELIEVEGGFKLYNPTTEKYLYAVKALSGNLAWHSTENSYWRTPSEMNIVYNANGAYLRVYNNTFRTYAGSSNGDPLYFAMKTTIPSYSNYCTTIPTLTITLYDACHDAEGKVYGTYSSSHPFVVSGDVVVSEISIVNDAFHVVAYETGAVVPANRGVMVAAHEGGNYTVNVAATEGASVLGNNNCLRPTGDNGITAVDMGAADEGCLFYRLTMHNGTKIGYWWGAENGAAFAVAANKAYMAIPEAQAARMMGNGFSEIFTGIVSTEQQRESVATYNLLGQRVSPDTKGVLIRNGKKLINK